MADYPMIHLASDGNPDIPRPVAAHLESSEVTVEFQLDDEQAQNLMRFFGHYFNRPAPVPRGVPWVAADDEHAEIEKVEWPDEIDLPGVINRQ